MPSESLLDHLSVIRDPRLDRNKKHDLHEMLFVAICAVISGAEGWSDIVEFAESKKHWLRRFVKLDNGVPVDDTFARVLSRISPRALQECFVNWTQAVFELTEGEIVAIDGKTARRSHNRRQNEGPLHCVRAWATRAGMALGQVSTGAKSNEIKAIPELLRQLELKGAIVTLDAMGCQRAVAGQVVEQGADYVLAVKANQPGLQEAVKDFFETAHAHEFAHLEVSYHEQVESGHGRVETRRCWACDDLQSLPEPQKWRGLRSIAMVESEREIDGHSSRERRFFISSLPPEAEPIARAVRAHWEIENGFHWVLDVTFREDESRIRRGHGAENFSTLRTVAVNLLKQEPSKRSIRKKRVRAGFSDEFREQVLTAARV